MWVTDLQRRAVLCAMEVAVRATEVLVPAVVVESVIESLQKGVLRILTADANV